MERNATMVAKGIAAGRMLYGAGCMVAPRTVMGPAGKRAEGQMVWLTRAFGVRDLVLGAGTFLALQARGPLAVPWVEVSAAADSLDAANAIVFRKELDSPGFGITLAVAVPASVAGWWSARQLRADT